VLKSWILDRRKKAAIILIAPLLWIHAVTLFHAHPSQKIRQNDDTALITTHLGNDDSTCSLCDYHLTKDVGLHPTYFDIDYTNGFYSHNSVPTSFNGIFCNLSTSGRAPPAFLS
jgi:hypothetical protein